jgi:hypothetical protein
MMHLSSEISHRRRVTTAGARTGDCGDSHQFRIQRAEERDGEPIFWTSKPLMSRKSNLIAHGLELATRLNSHRNSLVPFLIGRSVN